MGVLFAFQNKERDAKKASPIPHCRASERLGLASPIVAVPFAPPVKEFSASPALLLDSAHGTAASPLGEARMPRSKVGA
jgi:hypothetical protein